MGRPKVEADFDLSTAVLEQPATQVLPGAVAGSVRAGTTEGEGQREASPFCIEDVDMTKGSS